MTQRCMPAHNEKPLITFIYTIIYSNVIILAHTFPFSYKMCTRYYHVIIIDNVWLFFVYTYIYAYAFNNAFILLFFKHTHARAHFHAITASVWMNACIFVCIYNVNNIYIYIYIYVHVHDIVLCCLQAKKCTCGGMLISLPGSDRTGTSLILVESAWTSANLAGVLGIASLRHFGISVSVWLWEFVPRKRLLRFSKV